MAESREMLFLKLALKNNLLQSEQADQIMASIEQRKELGVTKTPAEIAIEKEFLSAPQVEALESALRSTLPPDKIGGFEIHERIGRGAVGTVYRGRQISLDKVVAVKVLHQNLTRNPKFVKQFIQEAKAAARINHPHVVHAIDAGFEDGYNYFAMEFVEGSTLRDQLKKSGRLPEGQTLSVGLAVCQGLANAHQNGILHRDVKPDNILIGKGGTVKIGDLGLAIPLDDTELLAEEHRRMGSPYYLSPEQATGQKIDERSDLYSLGATLYHTLTGKPLFTGASVKEIFTKQVHQQPIPIQESGVEVSEATAELIMRLVEKDPDARFQTAEEVVEAIHAARRESTAPDPRATALPPSGSNRAGTRARTTPGTASAASGGRVGGATPRRRRPRSEPLISEGEVSTRSFGGRRQNTWAMVGGGTGALIGVLFIFLAISNNGKNIETEREEGTTEQKITKEIAAKQDRTRVERIKKWVNDFESEPSAQIKKALAEFGRKAGGDDQLLLAGYWNLLKNTPHAPNSFDIVEKINSHREETRNRGLVRATDGVFKEAKILADKGQWWDAIQKLDKLPKDLMRDDLVVATADELILGYESEIDTRYEEEMARVKQLRRDKQYDRVLEILDGIASYADPEFQKDAENIRADVDDERESFLKKERKRIAKTERTRYLQSAGQYVALCQARDFKGMISKALELDLELTTPTLKKMVEQDLKAAQLLDSFMKDFVKACGDGIGTNKIYKLRLKDKTKHYHEIAKVGDDRIWVLIKGSGGGTAQLPLDIAKISDESIFKVLADYFGSAKAEYLLPMGILYTYRKQGDVAREFLKQAQTAGEDVTEWLEKLDELVAS